MAEAPCVLQLQPLLNRIKEMGENYSKTNTQVHPCSFNLLTGSFFFRSCSVEATWFLFSHNWSMLKFLSKVSVCIGGIELASSPGECHSDPRGEECSTGWGIRWCTWLETYQWRDRWAALLGDGDKTCNRFPRWKVVNLHKYKEK